MCGLHNMHPPGAARSRPGPSGRESRLLIFSVIFFLLFPLVHGGRQTSQGPAVSSSIKTAFIQPHLSPAVCVTPPRSRRDHFRNRKCGAQRGEVHARGHTAGEVEVVRKEKWRLCGSVALHPKDSPWSCCRDVYPFHRPTQRCCQTSGIFVIPKDCNKSEAEDCGTYTQRTPGRAWPLPLLLLLCSGATGTLPSFPPSWKLCPPWTGPSATGQGSVPLT
ncbi:uncharacterized protein LOC132216732 isoform X1 [Myotis daubentonii]|uniref:uncharacterized protein LOC132216732 isoform X1 n=1 Tax=Myotis daubentonii TaxID=98922 RepID=UPI00287336E2|nr:uncharacterized protein LOC132216732 isoform X1 [Myotis daubentonii]